MSCSVPPIIITFTGWAWPLAEIFTDNMKVPMAIVNEFLDPILTEAISKHQRDSKFEKHMNLNKEEVREDDSLLDYLVRFTEGEIAVFVTIIYFR